MKSFARVDLILAALFLWINFFFAARSANLIAVMVFLAVLSLLACLIAISSIEAKDLLAFVFRFETLRALFAVLVTGIFGSIIHVRAKFKHGQGF